MRTDGASVAGPGRARRLAGLALAAALLAGCETTPEPLTTDAVTDPSAAFAARQARLAELEDWHAAGRMAVKEGEEGWSATVSYEAHGARWRLRLSGPLGQGALQLAGEPGLVTITDNNGRSRSAESPEALLKAAIGRSLPVSGLRYWLRGDVDPNRPVTAMVLGENGLLESLEQAGWRIEYSSYLDAGELPMPRRLTLTRGDVSGKIAIQRWRFGEFPAS